MNSVASPLRPEMAAAARRHPRAAGRDDVLAKAHAIALAQAQIQAQVQGYAAPAPARMAPQTRTAAASASSHRPRFRSASGSNVPVQPRPQPQPQQFQPRDPTARTLRQLHGDPRDRQPRTTATSNCRATSTRTGAVNPSTRTATVNPSTNSSVNPAGANANLSARSSVTRTRVSEEKPRPSNMTKQAEPVEWRVAVDPKSKRPYYYHPVTRETTWKKPAELVARERRDKARFFAHMERNIRAKLRDGRWLRDSTGSLEDERQSSSSTTSTASSSRSSLGASSLGTSSSAPPAALFLATRSLPTTPDFGRAADVGLVDGDNQRESDGEDEATARPTLFRTLSSYETPVAAGAKRAAVPSPIHERVRLAKLAPRASDLESYARTTTTTTKSNKSAAASDMMTNTTSKMTPTTSPTRTPKPRRRSNSTGTIFVRMGTMNAPDQDCTIQCVATVLRAHMMEALDAPVALDPRFDLFVGQRERRLAAIADDDNQAEAALHGEQDAAAAIPALSEIAAFVTHVFSRAQMESECIIMSLIYVERLLKATSGALQLRGKNWRRVLFCSMVMASKVWDDLSMCNADFSKIWPELSLKQINELELTYLSAVEYNVRVSAVSYAKYYFHLRSMCATMGMAQSFDESAPLNLDGARKMQVLSEEYQERSKLLPAPRRRSVTITTTSSAERLRSASGKPKAAAKPSPAASLEQLVQMQVRPAGGGNSLSSSMYRLSTLSKQG